VIFFSNPEDWALWPTASTEIKEWRLKLTSAIDEVKVLEIGESLIKIACQFFSKYSILVVLKPPECRIYLEAADLFQDNNDLSLMPDFVRFWLSSVHSVGGQDHFLGRTPFTNVYWIKSGMQCEIDIFRGAVSISNLSYVPRYDFHSLNFADFQDIACETFDRALVRQCPSGLAIAELSGGIDSSLVAYSARKALRERFLFGLHVVYDGWEFRREIDFARAAGKHADCPVVYAKGQEFGLWSFLDYKDFKLGPFLPSIQIPSLSQALSAAVFARESDAQTVLTGHGGDLVLSMPNLQAGMVSPVSQVNYLFKKPDNILRDIVSKMQEIYDKTIPNTISSGVITDNPWLSNVCFDNFGVQYLSVFSDEELSCFLVSFSGHTETRAVVAEMRSKGIQRPIANLLFGNRIAPLVSKRRWKVNHLALQFLAWAKYGRVFTKILMRNADYFSAAGIDPKRVVQRALEMHEGKGADDRSVNALVALSYWMECYKLSFNITSDSLAH